VLDKTGCPEQNEFISKDYFDNSLQLQIFLDVSSNINFKIIKNSTACALGL